MLRRVVRVELKVVVSMCGFPADASFYSSIGVPGCHGAQKCDGSVIFFFHCNFFLCSLIALRWEWNSVRCSRAMQTWLSSIDVSIPPLRRMGAVIKALSLTRSITKFAKIALTVEPIGQPNICL